MALFDSHCHLQFRMAESLRMIPSMRPQCFGVASTQPADWDKVQTLYNAFPPSAPSSSSGSSSAVPPGSADATRTKKKEVYPAFGIHPWWAHKVLEPYDEWLARLTDLLSSTPEAVCGEIGLDKITAKREAPGQGQEWTALYDVQRTMFVAQLRLAAKLGKPVVCHCVGSFGDLFDVLSSGEVDPLPPRVYMHAYGGSVDYARNLMSLEKKGGNKATMRANRAKQRRGGGNGAREGEGSVPFTSSSSRAGDDGSSAQRAGQGTRFYFGFSAAINLKSKKTESVLQFIPADRLLLESDLEQPHSVDECVDEMLGVIARCKECTPLEAAHMTMRNAQAFYGIHIDSESEEA